MGLFDTLSEDPKEQAMLALYAGLLGNKGSFGQVAGQSMMGAMETLNMAKKRQMEAAAHQQEALLNKLKLQEYERKVKLEEDRPRRLQEAISSFPKAGVVAGPPTAEGAYPTRNPTEQDYMGWAINSYAIDPNIAKFGFDAAGGVASREDKQQEARERQAAQLKAMLDKAEADRQAAAQRQADALQGKKDLAQIIAANRPPRAESAPEPLVQVVDPNTGKPMWATRSQAVGMPAASGIEKLKPIPPAVNTAIVENKQAQDRINRALTLLEGKNIGDPKKGGRAGDKDATGWKGYLPDAILKRVDPIGTDVRAEIADIGSLKIHDRSGAAVTISEAPRLMPFIPLTTDPADVVARKLRRLKTELEDAGGALKDIYSEEQGYKPNPISGKQGSGGWTIEVEKP